MVETDDLLVEDHSQIMAVKDFKAFQDCAGRPGYFYQAAGYGRRKRNSAKGKPAAGEKLLYLPGSDTAHLFVGGIQPEVVPDYDPLLFSYPYHLVCDSASDFRIEYRCEHRTLKNQIKRPIWEREVLSIGIGERKIERFDC